MDGRRCLLASFPKIPGQIGPRSRLLGQQQQQSLFAMKNIDVDMNVNDRRAARKEYTVVLAAQVRRKSGYCRGNF